MRNISKKIRKIRRARQLTQEDLANQSGISLDVIRKIENFEIIPLGNTLNAIAISLHVSAEELYNKKRHKIFHWIQVSQFTFLFAPLLNILIPFLIWKSKSGEIAGIHTLAKRVINFQLTWTLLLLILSVLSSLYKEDFFFFIGIILLLNIYNFILVSANILKKKAIYKPTFKFIK